jgi:hypothetical protein
VLYSAWKKQLLGSASRDFEDREAKPGVQEQRREAEPQRLKNLIAEIAAKNLKLKNEKNPVVRRLARRGRNSRDPVARRKDR